MVLDVPACVAAAVAHWFAAWESEQASATAGIRSWIPFDSPDLLGARAAADHWDRRRRTATLIGARATTGQRWEHAAGVIHLLAVVELVTRPRAGGPDELRHLRWSAVGEAVNGEFVPRHVVEAVPAALLTVLGGYGDEYRLPRGAP